jgi:hypothetical protein
MDIREKGWIIAVERVEGIVDNDVLRIGQSPDAQVPIPARRFLRHQAIDVNEWVPLLVGESPHPVVEGCEPPVPVPQVMGG